MADYDLIVRNAKIVTEDRQTEGDIGVKDGKVAASRAGREGHGNPRDRCGRQVRAARRHRQPCAYRAEVRLRHHVRRRLLQRHGVGGARRTTTVIPPAAQHRVRVASPGAVQDYHEAAGAEGGDRLRLPSRSSPILAAGAGPDLPALIKDGYTLVQDLHDLRRHEAGQRLPDARSRRWRARARW